MRALAMDRDFRETVVHTGQHYDRAMSALLFEELGLPEPDFHLGVGSGSHGQQTARMLEGVEETLVEQRPDLVLVYGDTNSTLAGALAACKLRIPLAHVEAGMRSFNRDMPEEYNRVLTDHAADVLLCSTDSARRQLAREGIEKGVHVVGDTMLDAMQCFREKAVARSGILGDLGLDPGSYVLATLHRPANVDDPGVLRNILEGLVRSPVPVVLPLHPRTRDRWEALGDAAEIRSVLRLIDPVGYLDMVRLEEGARAIVTDSGGVQKEAFFLEVPCVTVREETEWTETVELGWNVLVGSDPDAIAFALREPRPGRRGARPFGDGRAAQGVVEALRTEVGLVASSHTAFRARGG